MAIKCPSIDGQLATFKKFQQSLSNEKLLHRVMCAKECSLGKSTMDQAKEIAPLFTGIWELECLAQEDTECEAYSKVQEAIANPSMFVLKPQKEGGGNNFFDADLKAALTDPLRREELRTYILMERIFPPQMLAHHFREGKHLRATSMSEIGFYSTIFARNDRKNRDNQQILVNETFGTLLRTKGSHSNEGGVNSGFSVIDKPFVVEELKPFPEGIKDPQHAIYQALVDI